MSVEKAGHYTEQTEKLPETKISKQADYARDMLEQFGRAGFEQMIKGTALEDDFAAKNLFEKTEGPAAVTVPGSNGHFEYKANVDLVNAVIELQTKVWGKNTREIDGWLGRKTLSRVSIWSSREKRMQLKSEMTEVKTDSEAIDLETHPEKVVIALDSLLKASAHFSGQLEGLQSIGNNGKSVSSLRSKLEKKVQENPNYLQDKVYVLGGQGNDFDDINNASLRAYRAAPEDQKELTPFYQRFQELVDDTESSVEMALASGAKHVVIIGRIQYNLSQKQDYQGREEMRKMYESWAKAYTASNPKLSFYDSNLYFPEPLYTYDGSHPSWSNPQSKHYYTDNWQYLRKHILDETMPVGATVATASTANSSVEG